MTVLDTDSDTCRIMTGANSIRLYSVFKDTPKIVQVSRNIQLVDLALVQRLRQIGLKTYICTVYVPRFSDRLIRLSHVVKLRSYKVICKSGSKTVLLF